MMLTHRAEVERPGTGYAAGAIPAPMAWRDLLTWVAPALALIAAGAGEAEGAALQACLMLGGVLAMTEASRPRATVAVALWAIVTALLGARLAFIEVVAAPDLRLAILLAAGGQALALAVLAVRTGPGWDVFAVGLVGCAGLAALSLAVAETPILTAMLVAWDLAALPLMMRRRRPRPRSRL